jgi:FtsH-binding integral membrane protein
MYFVPIVALLLVIVIASVWSPIFALIIAVPLFLVFLGYVGFSRRANQETSNPSGEPVSGEGGPAGGGVWGERKV